MKRSQVISIHAVFWVMFVILPMLIFRLDDIHRSKELFFFLHQTLINMIIFYLVYLVLIPQVLLKRKMSTLVWISLGFILTMSLLRIGMNYFLREVLDVFEGRPFRLERQIFREFFGTLIYTFYPILIYFSIEWYRERQYRNELVREKQKSEIDLLKSQVNPHFLMNTLNNLYSLVYQGSKQASEAVLRLSDIMRYMLYETGADFVPLENEVKFLQSFVDLQLLRMKDKDSVDVQVTGDPAGRMIAPMLLIPFVENAFKHGRRSSPGKGISIHLSIEQKRIIFEVLNQKVKEDTNKDGASGIGLPNLRKRLDLQYPGKHMLEIEDSREYYKIRLLIED